VRTLAWTHTVEGPVRLSFGDAFRARLAGEALNALLPMGMLVGEPMKAEHVAHRLPFAIALRALAVEFGFYGVSLVLLFSAGAVALFPFSAVLFFAAMAIMVVPFLRNGKGWTRILERMGASQDHVNPRRAWRLLVLEVTFQLFAVVEVYVTLALITPQHVAWSSALLLETVSRAITIVFKMLPMRLGVDEAGAAVFADRLGLGPATGITLALVRRMRLLCWSAVGIVFVLMRLTRRSAAPAEVGISAAHL